MARDLPQDGKRPGHRNPTKIDVVKGSWSDKAATHVCADSSSPRSTSLNLRIYPEALLRESQPKIAEILATRQDLIGLDDGIAGLEEAGTALLELHRIHYELNNQRISVLRHKLLWSIGRRRLGHTVKVADGNRAVFEGKRREERLDKAMLFDQPLRNNPKYLCPDLADCVNSPVSGLVECLVRGWIDGIVLRGGQYQVQ
jgi:hypothetical protein